MSDLPKYLSISNDLRTRIGVGEFATGDRLPSQHSLADDYGVTVMTLRQALAALEAEGLVRAVKGTGTFVTEPPSVRYDLDHLSSFTQEMTEQGLDVVTEVVAIDHDPAHGGLARRALGRADGDPIVEVVRRRSVGGDALVLQRSTLAASIWEQLASADLASQPLSEALADRCGIVLATASETIRAINVDADAAELLGVAVGVAVFESIRVSRTADARAVLYDRALLSGSATEIRTERSAAGTRVAFQAL